MAIISLNNIVTIFKDWRTAKAPFLNSFGYGPISEFGTTTSMQYPTMWVDYQESSSIEVSNRSQTPKYSFYVLFVDQINNQSNVNNENGYLSNNRADIMSDMYQMAQDFINDLMVIYGQSGILIEGEPTLSPVEDDTPDKVCGWNLSITLKTKHFNCSIPSLVPPSCAPVTVTDSDGITIEQVASGSSFVCTPVQQFQPVTIHNSDNTFTLNANSGQDVPLPDILIELGNGDTEEFPSVKDIQLLDYFKILNDTGTRTPVVSVSDPTTQVQWQNIANCTAGTGTITKSSSNNFWDGNGSFIINTTQDFKLEFKFIDASSVGMVGISFADVDNNYTSIFANIYNYGFGYQIYVAGSFAAPYNNPGAWPCKIERIGTQINLYINNLLIHSIALPSSNNTQMVFDSSFYTIGSGVENILLTYL